MATGYSLGQRGCETIILEQAAQAGNAWRNDRWDSFTLVTPNWSIRLPGVEYQGDDPDGYLRRDEIVAYFEQYVERYHMPVRYGARVTAVEQNPTGKGYLVRTDESTYEASNVVMATGLYQRPKTPPFTAELPPHITQMHSGQYRNPQALPPGAVLVIGSGQSGCQLPRSCTKMGVRPTCAPAAPDGCRAVTGEKTSTSG